MFKPTGPNQPRQTDMTYSWCWQTAGATCSMWRMYLPEGGSDTPLMSRLPRMRQYNVVNTIASEKPDCTKSH